jgi:hypothetical protein
MTRTRLLTGFLAMLSLASWGLLVARERQRQDPLTEPFKAANDLALQPETRR